MNATDALTAVAEISLGLAGFTGIIMALYSRAESWSQLDAIRATDLAAIDFDTKHHAGLQHAVIATLFPVFTIFNRRPFIA